MLGFLSLYYLAQLAAQEVDQAQFILYLGALHKLQVQVVLGVGLALHVDRVAAQQVLQRAQRFSDAGDDQGRLNLAQVGFVQDLLVDSEAGLTFVALDVRDKARHQLVHRDRDVVQLPFGGHLIPELLKVSFKSCYKGIIPVMLELTLEGGRRLGDCLPSFGVHAHLQIEGSVLLDDASRVTLAIKTLLDHLPVNGSVVHSTGLPKHVGDLFHIHVNAVLLKQSNDLAAIERAGAIFIQLLKHVVDDRVRFDLSTRVVVMRVGVSLGVLFEPLFISLLMHELLTALTLSGDTRGGLLPLLCLLEEKVHSLPHAVLYS